MKVCWNVIVKQSKHYIKQVQFKCLFRLISYVGNWICIRKSWLFLIISDTMAENVDTSIIPFQTCFRWYLMRRANLKKAIVTTPVQRNASCSATLLRKNTTRNSSLNLSQWNRIYIWTSPVTFAVKSSEETLIQSMTALIGAPGHSCIADYHRTQTSTNWQRSLVERSMITFVNCSKKQLNSSRNSSACKSKKKTMHWVSWISDKSQDIITLMSRRFLCSKRTLSQTWK